MSKDSELILAHRIDTQRIIKAKYHLPPRKMRIIDPGEYIRSLEGKLSEMDISIKEAYERSAHPNVSLGTFSRRQRTIYLPPDTDLRSRAVSLEHETVHASQFCFSPRLSDRALEYEAYLIAHNPRFLNDPKTASAIAWFIKMSLYVNRRKTYAALDFLRSSRPPIM